MMKVGWSAVFARNAEQCMGAGRLLLVALVLGSMLCLGIGSPALLAAPRSGKTHHDCERGGARH